MPETQSKITDSNLASLFNSDEDNPSDFPRELCSLINKHSIENGSNTPDFILADFLTNCLKAFNLAATSRETWYGRK